MITLDIIDEDMYLTGNPPESPAAAGVSEPDGRENEQNQPCDETSSHAGMGTCLVEGGVQPVIAWSEMLSGQIQRLAQFSANQARRLVPGSS